MAASDPELVCLYAKTSAPQIRWANEVLSSLPIEWARVDGTILDIGCGPGEVTVACLSNRAGLKEISGFDRDPGMIEYARQHNAVSNVAYVLGDVMDLKTLPEEWLYSCGFVFSHMVLNDIVDQHEAMLNIAALLVPGGEIVHIWASGRHHEFMAAMKQVCSDPKWSELMYQDKLLVPDEKANALNAWRGHDPASGYAKLVSDCGYDVLSCKYHMGSYIFADRTEATDFLSSVLGTRHQSIPANRAAEFTGDFLNVYMELTSQTDSESVQWDTELIVFHAKKI